MTYILLMFSIIAEVFGTMMMKLSEGFTILLPSTGVLVAFVFSFYFLGLCLNELPLSTAYAIWAVVGTGLTAIIGIVAFDEAINFVKTLSLLPIIGGVVLLNKAKSDHALAEDISMKA